MTLEILVTLLIFYDFLKMRVCSGLGKKWRVHKNNLFREFVPEVSA